MKPQKIIKNEGKQGQRTHSVNMSAIFSTILDQQVIPSDPQSIRVRHNILLILLVLSAYGVYYFIGQFVDTIIIASISGIAYQQARQRFIDYVSNKQTYQSHKKDQNLMVRFVKCTFFIVLIAFFPYFKHILDDLQEFRKISTFREAINLNYQGGINTITIIQIVAFLWILCYVIGYRNILGFLKYFRPDKSYSRNFVKKIFGIIVILLFIFILVIIPIFLYKEVITTGSMMESQIEESFGCELVTNNLGNHTLPYCTQKLAGSSVLKRVIEELKYQNETITECIQKAITFQQNSFGSRVFEYQQLICTGLCWTEKANTYFNDNTKNVVLSTSTNVFLTLFGSLSSVILVCSNLIFNFTIFVSMFFFSVQNFGNSGRILKQIFGGERAPLTREITNLMSATFFIVLEHLVMSFLILQLFSFSSINILISILLSFMAFIPFFRPWFGVLIMVLLSLLFGNIRKFFSLESIIRNLELYPAIFLVVIYRYCSQRIYTQNFVKMQVNQIITNMSVLFGIYQFGVVGIIYGPLIIIIFKFVQKELLSKKTQSGIFEEVTKSLSQ